MDTGELLENLNATTRALEVLMEQTGTNRYPIYPRSLWNPQGLQDGPGWAWDAQSVLRRAKECLERR